MKRLLFVLTAGLYMGFASAARLNVETGTLNYGMYFGPLRAGDAKLVTTRVDYNGHETIRMDLIANTTKLAEKIYYLHDTLTTFIRISDSSPVHFRKHCFEGDDIVREKVDYTKLQNGSYSVSMRKDFKDGRIKENTVVSEEPVYDMVSIMAYARSINPSDLQSGERLNFKLASSARLKDEFLIFQDRETLKIAGRQYNCLVFKLVEPTMEKGILKENDILIIYLSDDPSRTIVQMDIKFKIGSAKVKLIPG